MNVKWTTAGLVTIIAALAIAFGLKSCERAPEAKIPPKLAKTLDSLDATAPAVAAHRDSVIRIVVHDTVHAAASSRAADKIARASDSLASVADSLAGLAAVQADSAALWHRAFTTMRISRDSAHFALVDKDSAYQREHRNTLRLLGIIHDDSTRADAITKANRDLRKRIDELEIPCRIVGPIPCPSRTVTMVLTTVTVTVAENASRRH